MYKRAEYQVIIGRLEEQRRFIQVVEQAILDRKAWGHIFESGIGIYLISQANQGNRIKSSLIFRGLLCPMLP